jgi:hypothetical protein
MRGRDDKGPFMDGHFQQSDAADWGQPGGLRGVRKRPAGVGPLTLDKVAVRNERQCPGPGQEIGPGDGRGPADVPRVDDGDHRIEPIRGGLINGETDLYGQTGRGDSGFDRPAESGCGSGGFDESRQ